MKTNAKILIVVLAILLSLGGFSFCVFLAGWKIALSITGIFIIMIGSIAIGGIILSRNHFSSKHRTFIGSGLIGVLVYISMVSGFFFNFLFKFKPGVTFTDFLLIPFISGAIAFTFSIVIGFFFKAIGKSIK
jgi:hypothetical protein